jgi:hypothetical protein
MDRKQAEKIFEEMLLEAKNDTIYNLDLEEETIKFYQYQPKIFIKTKRNIIDDMLNKKEQIINELMNEN